MAAGESASSVARRVGVARCGSPSRTSTCSVSNSMAWQVVLGEHRSLCLRRWRTSFCMRVIAPSMSTSRSSSSGSHWAMWSSTESRMGGSILRLSSHLYFGAGFFGPELFVDEYFGAEVIVPGMNFRLIWLGYTLSAFGDFVVPAALALAVVRATGSASALALVLACASVPRLVLLPIGGVLADRWSPRTVAIVADVVRAVVQVRDRHRTGQRHVPADATSRWRRRCRRRVGVRAADRRPAGQRDRAGRAPAAGQRPARRLPRRGRGARPRGRRHAGADRRPGLGVRRRRGTFVASAIALALVRLSLRGRRRPRHGCRCSARWPTAGRSCAGTTGCGRR